MPVIVETHPSHSGVVSHSAWLQSFKGVCPVTYGTNTLRIFLEGEGGGRMRVEGKEQEGRVAGGH